MTPAPSGPVEPGRHCARWGALPERLAAARLAAARLEWACDARARALPERLAAARPGQGGQGDAAGGPARVTRPTASALRGEGRTLQEEPLLGGDDGVDRLVVGLGGQRARHQLVVVNHGEDAHAVGPQR